MSIRAPRLALLLLFVAASAFSQSASKVAPLPYDPLELATGPTVVPDTPGKCAVLLDLLERARQNSAMHTPRMAPFSIKVSFNSTGGDSHSQGYGELEETWLNGQRNSRTTGAFAASYKTRVLPDFISVIDDPTISSYGGQALLGHYATDDEGVPAQRVALVEKGTLVNYVIGREPIRDFPTSNGHGRARVPTNPAGPSLGNVIVTSTQTLSKDELKKKLIDLCQQRDLPYGYYVETFGPALSPRLLYKVWVKDGHEELVRGGAFGDLDIRALRSDLIAAGDTPYVDNHPLNIPHSIVAPSILFDELEVKRANQNKERLPEYPAPAVGK